MKFIVRFRAIRKAIVSSMYNNDHCNNRYAISQAWVKVHISNYSLSQDFQGFSKFPGFLRVSWSFFSFSIDNNRYVYS